MMSISAIDIGTRPVGLLMPLARGRGDKSPRGGQNRERKMRLIRALSCLVAIVLLGGSGTAVAQSEVFMCVDGIAGGSTDQQFAGCSQIFAVSYSVGSQDQPR